MNVIQKKIHKHWIPVSHFFSIHDEKEYDRAVELLDSLIDEIGTNDQHPLYEFFDILGTVIHAYEEKHYQITESGPADMFSFFIKERGLTLSDFPEIGSENVISEIVKGKREFSVKDIRILAKRFSVSPAVFI